MIEYRENQPLEPVEIARVFETSGISRPTKDIPRIAQMFANANVVISAWDGARFVGVSRALTDYSYCCYLSDLAVDVAYQKHGIGRELIRRTQSVIGDEVSLVLMSAPGAMAYYPKVGFALADNAYVIRRKR
ncbi:GNAT family N-acetyltransferase [Thiobacillus sp.]|uniref:GNAT family N-acetyltransferase n=1 Tax=Thiobacillus sp. TaxID=924 RepID=UPI00286DEB05|nr:GNAT family N-acetyltransferase [Thiobacillus sp.]